MVNFLARILIEDYEDYADPKVRQGYGVVCGMLCVVLNIMLCAGKMAVGIFSGSVAIISDAVNNLSDAGSSIVTMIGFKMAGQKPDTDHPFGHGRIEYISGLIVSIIIIVLGVELGKSSIDKIMSPMDVFTSTAVFVVMEVAIVVKLYMYYINKQISEKIQSTTMKAVSMDSFTDAIATTAVLISVVIYEFTGINIDGWCGLLVSVFIIYTGINAVKDTVTPLLGTKASPEYVEAIEKYAMAQKGILGIHDLIIHDYGPGRAMISFHAEVPANSDFLEIHDTIDNIESKLKEVLNCDTVIHMDPVVTDNAVTGRMRDFVKIIVNSVDEELSIHDFRMVEGKTHTNLIFDLVVPHNFRMTDDEVVEEIKSKISELPGEHYAVIKVDKPYY